MSATELAEAIRSGQVSSHEVVEAHLRRIEEVNPAVNAPHRMWVPGLWVEIPCLGHRGLGSLII